jgi:hypothetical protein
MPLGPCVHGRKRPSAIGQRTVLSRARQQMHAGRTTGKLLVDVAFAVGDHGDARRLSQHIGSFFRREQPTIGCLVLDRASAGSLDLGPSAIENLSAYKTDYAAMDGIDRNFSKIIFLILLCRKNLNTLNFLCFVNNLGSRKGHDFNINCVL